MLPLVVGLETLPGGNAFVWQRYVLNMMLVGFPYVHAIIGEFGPSQVQETTSVNQISGYDES